MAHIERMTTKTQYDTEELQLFTEAAISQLGGVCKVASAYGVNSGNVTHARNGEESRIMRRVWKLPKRKPRPRLIVSCSEEMKQRYDTMRGELSRGEYLTELLDLAEGLGIMWRGHCLERIS